MTYRAELSPRARRQLAGIPLEARFALAEALSIVVDAPYDPTFTEPTPHPDRRQTIFGGLGVIEYMIWDELHVVVALDVIWSG